MHSSQTDTYTESCRIHAAYEITHHCVTMREIKNEDQRISGCRVDTQRNLTSDVDSARLFWMLFPLWPGGCSVVYSLAEFIHCAALDAVASPLTTALFLTCF